MINEVMMSLDLETMDTGPEAAVLSIGARIFTKDGPAKGFEVFIDQNLAAQFGTTSMDTIKWWNQQDRGVYEQVFGGKLHPADAVHQLRQFVKLHSPSTVWANSPSFDCVILRNLCKKVNLEFPFHFRDERDFRTLFAIGRDMGLNLNDCWKGLRAHLALDDATAQAKAGALILSKIYAPALSTPAVPADQDSDPQSTAPAQKSRGRASTAPAT